MMTKIISLISLLTLNSSFSNAQSWHKQNILNLATLEFPDKPDYIDTLGVKAYRYVGDSVLYIVEIFDLSKENNINLKKDSPEDLYDGVVSGIIERSNGKLIKKDNFEISGLKGAEFEMTYTANPSLPDLQFYKMIFNNLNLIVILFGLIPEMETGLKQTGINFLIQLV